MTPFWGPILGPYFGSFCPAPVLVWRQDWVPYETPSLGYPTEGLTPNITYSRCILLGPILEPWWIRVLILGVNLWVPDLGPS